MSADHLDPGNFSTGVRRDRIMMQFQCGRCSKELRCPDQFAGHTVQCPGCRSPLRVPDMVTWNFFDRSKRRNWFQRVFGRPDEKVKAIRDLGRGQVARLQQLADFLSSADAKSRQRLAEAADGRCERTLQKFLKTTTIEKLSEFSTGATIKTLRAAGIRTLEDLQGWPKQRLLELHRIGPATANNILNSFRKLCARATAQANSIPGPDSITDDYRDILKTAYRSLQSRNISSRFVTQLCSLANQGNGLLVAAESSGRFLDRLLNLEAAESKIAKTHSELDAWCKSDEVAECTAKAEEAEGQLRAPHQAELVEDYRQRYADYVALFESQLGIEYVPRCAPKMKRDRPEYGDAWRHAHGVAEAPPAWEPPRTPSLRGGVASEIADRVEKLQLSLDGLRIQLRGYQAFGIKYLVHQKRTVLGDEMGLGKTIQALGAMVHLTEAKSARRFLVVAPASIIGNWVKEIQRCTELAVRVLHGPFREYELATWQNSGGVAITSYTTLGKLMSGLNRQPIDLLVADEAHYIKNPSAVRSRNVATVANRAAACVLMTGTPLENHAIEFVELIKVCDEQTARRVKSTALDGRDVAVDPAAFERRISSVYLRRNQEDVLHELPECIQIEEWVELGDSEWSTYYRAVESRALMKMRYATLGNERSSAKLSRFEDLMDDYRERGEKVVVFSFFLKALDQVGSSITETFRLDGSVPVPRRQQIIEEFNRKRGFAAMIAQIEAGGVGINLQSASSVIILEPQLKPTTEWQAIKRVHRMGQSRRVIVHRLLARNTVDERIHELLGGKAATFDAYARESQIKQVSRAARDTAVSEHQLVEHELKRLKERQLVGSIN